MTPDRRPGVLRALRHGRRTTAEIAGHTLYRDDEIEAALALLVEAGAVIETPDGWILRSLS